VLDLPEARQRVGAGSNRNLPEGTFQGAPSTDLIPAFEISGRKVGPGYPCLIVGEVAQAHEGSLGMAQAFITTKVSPYPLFSAQVRRERAQRRFR
jgi:hypothetical protein